MILLQVADVIVKWNCTKEYSAFLANGQHFIEDLCEKGMGVPLSKQYFTPAVSMFYSPLIACLHMI